MKKTKESIQLKWQKKYEQLKLRTERDNKINIMNLSQRIDKVKDYRIERLTKKKNAYLNKKYEEYKRKCLNEIRELEGKPQREYKQPAPTKNKLLQFALDIAQENAKLRDTDVSWRWECISHATPVIFNWEDLAWWHLYSRMIQWICLFDININAQCHTCNRITWPQGNVELKEITNKRYRDNLIKKNWLDAVLEMEEHMQKYLWDRKKYSPTVRFLVGYIPELIDENEELWKTKNFYKPKKNRRKQWEKISALIPNLD